MSLCVPFCPTKQVVLFLESGSPPKSLSTKIAIFSACSCLRNSLSVLGVPTRYLAVRFDGTTSNSRGSLILRAKCVAVPPSLLCLEPNATVACKQTCFVLHLPSSELDSCSRLTHPCLVVSLVVCALFKLHPDYWMMRSACCSGLISKNCSASSASTRNTRFSNRRRFASEIPGIAASPCLFAVYYEKRSESM